MRTKWLLFILPVALLLLNGSCSKQAKNLSPEDKMTEKKIDALLKQMTLEEKVGQMNQYSGWVDTTGPNFGDKNIFEEIKKGWVGSVLNITGAENVRKVQQMAVDCTRLHIPLIFGLDVIHGYRTIFPVPLAEACSWDLEAIEKGARIAATEASSAGVNWTFAPMVDIARDPRWGRIMEGAGEDPYLGSLVAVARVKGFQGSDLSANNTIVACAKHYAAYGGAEGGRDYNTVDMSERTLRDVYLRPFKAAAEAGCGTFMNSFNEIGGIPSTGNPHLLRDILKGEWNFRGFVVSDWGSVGEMINHGVAANKADAAALAATAGCDMDMESRCYREELVNLVRQGKVDIKYIDDAVRRILRIKFQLGLFDDPYRYCNPEREKELILHPDHLKAAKEMAVKSMVLLRNEGHILPLKKSNQTIALIGPLAASKDDMIGGWSALGQGNDAVSLYEGLTAKLGNSAKIVYARGCGIAEDNRNGFQEAINAARKADVILLAMGENRHMSGEASSRAYIGLPGVQEELIKEIMKLGKPTVLVLFNGRPLTIPWIAEHVPAILEAWFPGIRAGEAIADILFGDAVPSGKLVTTFPHSLGQVPLYYNHKNTGRPYSPDSYFTSRYLDETNDPLFPFGYGLSYTTFAYSGLQLSDSVMTGSQPLNIFVTVTNTGNYDAEEVVQLYVRDMVGSVTRPVKELKGFKKILIKKGESVKVSFTLTEADLRFYDASMNFVSEPGEFRVFVGGNSRDVLEGKFWLRL
jgi:beta-glucosidase